MGKLHQKRAGTRSCFMSFSLSALWTSSISSIWELIIYADPQTLPQMVAQIKILIPRITQNSFFTISRA